MPYNPRILPANNEAFRHRTKQSQKDVLRKLCRKYDIKNSDIELDSKEQARLDGFIDRSEDKFKERIALIADRADIAFSPDETKELLDVCNDFARSCYHLCKLRLLSREKALVLQEAESKTAAQPVSQELPEGEWNRARIHASTEDARMIENIYASHVIEEALVKMKSSGLTEKGAISLADVVIENLTNSGLFRQNYLIEPYKPLGASEIALEGWRDQMMGGLRETMMEALKKERRESGSKLNR
jgi:hypothetical protein